MMSFFSSFIRRGRWSFGGLPYFVILIIVGGLAIHLAASPFSGLSRNESYVVVMARHFSLSYVDHPPLTMWLVSIIKWLTGSEAGVIVRLPSMLLFCGTTWLIYRIGETLFNSEAGVYGVLALNLSPLFFLFIGEFAVTDGPMLFFVVLSNYLLLQALFNPSGKAWLYWLGTGFFTGVAMLAKYTAVFVPFGVGLFLLTQPAYRRWLWHPAPYLALLVCAIVFSPVIIWNIQHDWISLSFQGNRALPQGGLKFGQALAYLGLMALYTLPWIWLALIAVLVSGLLNGPKDVSRWFLCCLSIGPILFFPLVRLAAGSEDKGYHWAAPGLIMLFPLLGATIQSWMPEHAAQIRRTAIASATILLIVLAVFISNSMTGWVRWLHPRFAQHDPLVTDFMDWNDLEVALRQRGLFSPKIFLIGSNWQDCVKSDYALGGKIPVLCLANQPLQFPYFQNQKDFFSQDAVIISRYWTLTDMQNTFGRYFSSIEPLESVMLGQFGMPVLRLNLFYGRNFHAVFPWPYGQTSMSRSSQ